jgi:hypothetical protein
MIRRLMTIVLSAATIALAGGVVPTATARAADIGVTPRVPQNCGYQVWSQIDSYRGFHMWDGKTVFADEGARGNNWMEVWVDRTATLSASISVGAEISINELIADSKVSISASVTKQVTTTTGHRTHYQLPGPERILTVKYGTWAYHVNWSKWRQNGNCSVTELDAGWGTVPTVATGWDPKVTSGT